MDNDLRTIDYSGIGMRIRLLLTDSNITKTELAARLGVSVTSIYKWIEAETLPDIQHLLDLSHIFGVTIDYIVKGDDTDFRD